MTIWGVVCVGAVVWVAVYIWKSNFTQKRSNHEQGRQFGKRVAEALGLEENLFHTILENGDMPVYYLSGLAAMERSGISPMEAAVELAPFLEKGISQLENRFGRQSQLDFAKTKTSMLSNSYRETYKKRAQLEPGEVSEDSIGCYLLGIEQADGSAPSYHSTATTKERLLQDAHELLEALITKKQELVDQRTPTSMRHAQDLKVLSNALKNLPSFVDLHLQQGGQEPFISFGGANVFLRKGAIPRDAYKGKLVGENNPS